MYYIYGKKNDERTTEAILLLYHVTKESPELKDYPKDGLESVLGFSINEVALSYNIPPIPQVFKDGLYIGSLENLKKHLYIGEHKK